MVTESQSRSARRCLCKGLARTVSLVISLPKIAICTLYMVLANPTYVEGMHDGCKGCQIRGRRCLLEDAYSKMLMWEGCTMVSKAVRSEVEDAY